MAYIPPLNGGRLNASIGGNSTSAGAGYAMLSTGTMVLAGGNNITLSQNGGSITISGANAPSGSINFSASNTSANLASVTFSNSNGVSFGLNAGVITASHNGITSQSNQALAGSNGSFAFQTATFGNLNGLSFYSSNGSMVGSYTVPTQSNQTIGFSAGNNTSLTSSGTFDARSLYLNGLGAASVGFSSSSLFVSTPVQTVQTQNMVSVNGSTGNISVSGGANITVGNNASTITISAAAQSAQTQNNIQAFYDGANSITTGTIRVSNANGISFGINGQTLTASHNALTSQTVQTQNMVSVNGSTGNVQFSNGNNVTFGGAGSTITASASFAQSNQTIGFSAGNNTSLTSAGTFDARSLYINGLGEASVGYSNSSLFISSPVQTVQTQNMVTLNGSSGNISVSGGPNITVGNNASTITISAAAQTNQTLGLTATGNTTQNTTATVDARSLIFNGLGNVSVGYSAGSIQISGAGGGGGGLAVNAGGATYSSGTLNIVNAGGALTINSTTGQSLNFSVPSVSSLSAAGPLTISTTNNNTITISAPPMLDIGVWGVSGGTTAGLTGSNSNGMALYAGSNINLSQSTDAGGASITISAAGGGGGGAGNSPRWEYPNQLFTTIAGFTNSSMSMQHIYIPFNISVRSARMAASFNVSSLSSSGTTGSINISFNLGIYTLNGSTLSSLATSSFNNGFSYTSGNYVSTAFNGVREITTPLSINLTPGDYWVAGLVNTAITNGTYSMSVMGNNVAGASGTLGVLGSAIGVSARDVLLGQGLLNTGALPSALALSGINNTSASNLSRAGFYHVLYNATY